MLTLYRTLRMKRNYTLILRSLKLKKKFFLKVVFKEVPGYRIPALTAVSECPVVGHSVQNAAVMSCSRHEMASNPPPPRELDGLVTFWSNRMQQKWPGLLKLTHKKAFSFCVDLLKHSLWERALSEPPCRRHMQELELTAPAELHPNGRPAAAAGRVSERLGRPAQPHLQTDGFSGSGGP